MSKHYSRQSSSSADDTPPINKIFKGKVTAVKAFGAFVKIPGYYKNGLVHRSQISKYAVSDPSEVLQTGETVWCKVISVNDEGKIGLSMKVVNQGSGKDLDPNGVEMAQEERKRQSHTPYKPNKIELDAVFNTTCKKCGNTGHLAQDCFQIPGGKKYDFIPDDDDDDEPDDDRKVAPPDELPEKKSDEKRENKIIEKEKKRSKHHKSHKKKRRRSSSSSDSDDAAKNKKYKSKREKP